MRARDAKPMIAHQLAELFGKPVRPLKTSRQAGPDFRFKVGQHRLAVEWKGSSSAHNVDSGIREAAERRTSSSDLLVLAVPFMGPSGRRRCREAEMSWLDLSGNAHIAGPNLLVHVDGRPNHFRTPGRPSSLFAPKSSRISRCFLTNVGHAFAHGELAATTGVDPGQTSRVLRGLREADLVRKTPDGRFQVPNPALLLRAWSEHYDFHRHRTIRGHLPGRTSSSRTKRIAESLRAAGIQHAATGLTAAWLYTHHANYRISTFYVETEHAVSILEADGLRLEERGANTWIVAPRDEGVFADSEVRDGIPCVSPVQVYLDLAAHPERAVEAADAIRSEYLPWAREDPAP